MKYLKIIAVCCVIGLFGCNRLVHVEEDTPPGSVPPPTLGTPSAQPAVPPTVPGPKGQSVSATERASDGQEEKAKIVAAFRQAYVDRGEPRLLLFVNRDLSCEVKEWREPGPGANGAGEQAAANGSADVPPGKKWIWDFEAGFVRTFLRALANVVDYATVLRLEADGRDLSVPLNVKNLEIPAMKKYADVHIEILVTADAASPVGYVFKSSAKEAGTGRILAVSTLTSPGDFEPGESKSVSVDAQGYRVGPGQLPSVAQASESLAIHMMSSLARIWAKITH